MLWLVQGSACSHDMGWRVFGRPPQLRRFLRAVIQLFEWKPSPLRWQALQARHSRTPMVGSHSQVDTGGFASIADVAEAPLRRMDKMESFWLAGAGCTRDNEQGLGVLRTALVTRVDAATCLHVPCLPSETLQ